MLGRILAFAWLMILGLPASAMAAEDDDPLYRYIKHVHDRLEHPEAPVYIAACTPAPSAPLSGNLAIALAFIGAEGWVISIDSVHDHDGFWVLGTMWSPMPGVAAQWDWTMGGIWISHQIWPITKQLGRDGLRPVTSASVSTILELAKEKTCDQEPWPPKSVIDALP